MLGGHDDAPEQLQWRCGRTQSLAEPITNRHNSRAYQVGRGFEEGQVLMMSQRQESASRTYELRPRLPACAFWIRQKIPDRIFAPHRGCGLYLSYHPAEPKRDVGPISCRDTLLSEFLF